MKKFFELISSKGKYLAISGFVITLAGVILMLIAQKNCWVEQSKSIIMSVAITGFALYFTGRILVSSQQRKNRSNSSSSLSSKE